VIYNAKVVSVTDGDTLVLSVDLGIRWLMGMRAEATRTKVRLSGCNSPEKNSAAGKAAKAWTTEWVKDKNLLLRVDTTKEEDPATEKYGRVFGDVITNDGRSLVKELIAAGHALPWDGKGERPV
jgi:endonuclease YncB( thermonuclease family)